MPIGAAVSAVGSLGGALLSSNASNKAADEQAASQQQALAQQQAMFNQGLGIAQNALNPFITAGTNILPTLTNLLTPGASQTATLSQLPGFQFQSEYGTQAATNALAARGLGGSTGPLARGISDYNQGLAGTAFSSLVNPLLQLYSGGEGAASALGTSALSGAITSGSNQAGNIVGTGNAQAAGTLGSANALAGGLNGAASSTVNALLLSKLIGSGSTGSGGLYAAGGIT